LTVYPVNPTDKEGRRPLEKMSEPRIMIDSHTRTFKWPGVAGARIRTGSCPLPEVKENGDCILLDFEKGFFAISDSSDRDPVFSRKFLIEFDSMLSRKSGFRLDQKRNPREIRRLRDTLSLESEKILKDVFGLGSCTFTGLHFCRTDKGFTGLLFHTGDSDLYGYDASSGEFSRLTRENFWMVGKTGKLFQISELEISPDQLLILATDGVTRIGQMCQPHQRRNVVELFHRCPVEDIPQKIMPKARAVSGFEDDAAAIAISPGNLDHSKIKVVMDGTTWEEEPWIEGRYSRFHGEGRVDPDKAG